MVPKVDMQGELWQIANPRRQSRPLPPMRFGRSLHEEVFQEFLSKHPQADPPTPSIDFVPLSIMILEMEVLRTLNSFPNGSSSGSSGLRAEHLEEAVSCPVPDCANQLYKL